MKKWTERREEVYLCNSVFDKICKDELLEIEKHEILAKICEIIGPSPANFCKAEDIFDRLKYEITRYVLHNEYCQESGIRSKLVLWLDSKVNPEKAEKLSSFMSKFLEKI
ncbi:hypothetical protein ACFL20_02740 [Spirochaetota bacterium]